MSFWPSIEERRRIRRITHVLFDNQLGYFVDRFRLRGSLPFHKRVKTEHFKDDRLAPHRVLKVFEELGGSFIKLGQLLSLRPDLIPAEYCEELSKLQDKVPSFPGKEAVQIIEAELKKPITKLFSEFNETPIAAASMGQVHLATLKDGTKVAVKVQRPGIQENVAADIKLLFRLAGMIQKRYDTKIISPHEIVHEFERYTHSELNYLKEAHHIDMFYSHFSKSQTIIIPKVFWNYTTGKVLTMEYIAGKKLSDMSKFTPATKKKIIDKIINAEFEQIFVHGFFHADPHPGNFLIKSNGKIALLDFGIVGRLDPELKENITDMFIGMINADVDAMVEAAAKLGVSSDETDRIRLKQDIYEHLSSYYGTTLDKIKVSVLLNNLLRMFRQNKLRVSPNFVLLAKATITLESIATKLDPRLNFVIVAKPFVTRMARERMSPRRIAERAKNKISAMVDFTTAIPQKANTLLAELHDTGKDLRRIDNDISSLTTEIDRSSNRVTLGFLAGTLFIASTILLPFQKPTGMGLPWLTIVGYTTALLVLFALFVSMLREKKI
jgi:ubiquinone biosynthesis protein